MAVHYPGMSAAIIAIVVGVLLLVFRPEVKKLVDWIVGFKRLAKTANGFAVEVLEPTVPPVIAVDRLEEAVLVTPKEISAPSESQDEGADNWAAAFFSKRYDDAVKFLDAELIVA